ncbi:phosphonate ABC transporter substrate-binding protein [Pseudothauera nasutitermitis]|uniref:Phosphonate ABC transporter substrate-binding protein n=1 Tax=Pseudothauera nasutitermitis TaxID=2565930 RepID=A0A4S4B522_9RHOO|nr:substrate-binding domain-containing protein [Pseudothauera nasutitermitis]THF66896.1 phosphonate ABC transporter substrate-binding protein [Pseudothauera nasutitermitis]
MFKKSLIATALVAVGASFAAPAMARDNLQIAGSSTVLPFASIVAEEFGNAFPQFKTPVVGSGGTGGGLRQFCQGVGANTIDIANASRAIRSAEVESCKKAGVNKIHEVQFGYDGIVFASRADKGSFALTPRHVFLAAAAEVPQGGKFVANPYTRWAQIDKALPDQEIVLVIPASNHGTREVFEEKVTHAGCNALDEVKALDADGKKKACNTLRQDGRIIEIAGDYTETLARLQAQADAVGVFGLSFYDQNRDRLKVATVDGVTPSLQTIASGVYPVSRPLYFYVKGEHIGVIPGLKEFAEFFLTEQISGAGSALESAGLIPLGDSERAKIVADLRAGKTVQ